MADQTEPFFDKKTGTWMVGVFDDSIKSGVVNLSSPDKGLLKQPFRKMLEEHVGNKVPLQVSSESIREMARQPKILYDLGLITRDEAAKSIDEKLPFKTLKEAITGLPEMMNKEMKGKIGFDTQSTGLDGYFDPKTGLIFLSPQADPNMRQSTLAHEISHASETQRGKMGGKSAYDKVSKSKAMSWGLLDETDKWFRPHLTKQYARPKKFEKLDDLSQLSDDDWYRMVENDKIPEGMEPKVVSDLPESKQFRNSIKNVELKDLVSGPMKGHHAETAFWELNNLERLMKNLPPISAAGIAKAGVGAAALGMTKKALASAVPGVDDIIMPDKLNDINEDPGLIKEEQRQKYEMKQPGPTMYKALVKNQKRIAVPEYIKE